MNTSQPNNRANLIGSLWMTLAMAIFAIEDVFIKAASSSVPTGQILIIFGLGGVAIFATIASAQKESLFPKAVLSKAMRIRMVFEITGRLFFVLAITLTPLSSVTVILQATPICVVAAATILFSEKVGWRRWSAIILGLIGVLIILQPGTDSFAPLSILAVIGMLGFAARDLASRAAPASLSTAVLGFYGFIALIIAGSAYALWQGVPFVWPQGLAILYLVGAILAGVAAYSCLMKAMRTGEVSAVTPFRYTRLIFGVGCGVVLFGETLSSTMLLGSGLIVLSGLFILWRSKQAAPQKAR
ncbi:DMT family transporter [Cognatishimia sp. 1_MG-2023]|uniref:DMT family transporter n=1 Tax=Cognatishimia sp. 1_MG-2023 TaxID=3062642 RepID=UPI0026E21E4A|nr:DMT family transporter [Cognatishimia sp. 1_MG-2023]MDO6726876.1 DMT family transporter [Cognatishimia sp. 1_MG-2023]